MRRVAGVELLLLVLAASCSSNTGGGIGAGGAPTGGVFGAGPSSSQGAGGANVTGAGGSSRSGAALGGSEATASQASPGSIGNCPVFPAADLWNRDISSDPIDPNSDAIIAYINGNGASRLHPDFGSDFGIPYTTVTSSQAKVAMDFDYESDPGPYPIPQNAPIEHGSDGHILVIDTDACLLYETFDSEYVGPGWRCGSGAVFDLKTGFRKSRTSYADCWTSADAAGLPIFPGLVRYEEVKAGAIHHAIRVTFGNSRQGFVHPATHFAGSSTAANVPPMGMRLRLSATYDISRFTGQSKVIATALKTYGFINADNGSNWYFQGAPDPRFDNEDLDQLKSIPGTAFEVVRMDRVYGDADCP